MSRRADKIKLKTMLDRKKSSGEKQRNKRDKTCRDCSRNLKCGRHRALLVRCHLMSNDVGS